MTSEPKKYVVQEKPFACLACAHDHFREREAQLNTATATFFGFDWANATANCLVCAKCGYVHWFLPQLAN